MLTIHDLNVDIFIAKFMTFTCKSRCPFMCSRCTFVKVWNADHVAEIYMQTVSSNKFKYINLTIICKDKA